MRQTAQSEPYKISSNININMICECDAECDAGGRDDELR